MKSLTFPIFIVIAIAYICSNVQCAPQPAPPRTPSGDYSVTHLDIRDAVLSLVRVLQDQMDKLERHEVRERQLGEQLTRSLASLEKRGRGEEKNIENIAAYITRIEEKTKSLQVSVDKQSEDRRKQFENVDVDLKSLRQLMSSISTSSGSRLEEKVDAINDKLSQIRLSTEATSSKFDRLMDLWRTSVSSGGSGTNDVSDSLLQELHEIKELVSNSNTGTQVATGRNVRTDWQVEIMDSMDSQRKQLALMEEEIGRAINLLGGMTQSASGLQTVLQELQTDTSRGFETVVSQIGTLKGNISKDVEGQITKVEDALRTGQQHLEGKMRQAETQLDKLFTNMQSGYSHLSHELKGLSNVESVLLDTGDSVLDTKRRLEYGVQQIMGEIANQLKESTANLNASLQQRFDGLATSVLGNQSIALTNLTSRMEEEISQVWRQIGILYHKMTGAAQQISEIHSQTSKYVNNSLDTMSSMDGKVGQITNQMGQVDDNLNYLLGRMSLVVQEFNMIKSGYKHTVNPFTAFTLTFTVRDHQIPVNACVVDLRTIIMSGNDLEPTHLFDAGPSAVAFDKGGNFTGVGGSNSEYNVSADEIPPEFTQMGPNSLNCIIAYTILFVIAATGNFSVFFSVLQQLRRTKSSRIGVLILHLSISDLLVTFGHIPLEVIWRITVQWYGGNLLCKICKFFSAFGLYLSSMVLICISLDRYFCILYPLRVSNARRRGKVMLTCAWVAAVICSAPQSIIFHVDQHPVYRSFHQCVTMGFFSTPDQEMIYNILSVTFMYFLPLAVIIFTYGMILCKISRKSRQQRESRRDLTQASGRILLRRNEALNHMERAKSRTLRLTFVIVLCFVLCWTPYVVITLWYMFYRESAAQVDGKIQDFLFIMAVANSCVNPLIYGTYTRECRESVTTCCGQSKCYETEERRRLQRQALLRAGSRKSTASFRLGTTTAPPTPPIQGHQDFHFANANPHPMPERNNKSNRSVRLKLPEDDEDDNDDHRNRRSSGSPNGRGGARNGNGGHESNLVVEYNACPKSPRTFAYKNTNANANTTTATSTATSIPLTHYNRINLEENPMDKNDLSCTAAGVGTAGMGKKVTVAAITTSLNHNYNVGTKSTSTRDIPGPKV